MTTTDAFQWLRTLPLDRQEVAALVPLFKAASECSQRWWWGEDRLVCLLRVCWAWIKTGRIVDIDEPLTIDAAEVTTCEPDRAPIVSCGGTQVVTS